MTTQEITQRVKKELDLNEVDKSRANERHNESKIDQIIANALQEKRFLCKNSLIERTTIGEFKITEAGKAELERRRKSVADMLALVEEMGIDLEDLKSISH